MAIRKMEYNNLNGLRGVSDARAIHPPTYIAEQPNNSPIGGQNGRRQRPHDNTIDVERTHRTVAMDASIRRIVVVRPTPVADFSSFPDSLCPH